MSFIQSLEQARALLERNGRLSLRALRREFELDDESLADMVEELVDVQQVAARDGEVLSWVGPAREATSDEPPAAEAPREAADRPSEGGELRQLTVLFCDLVDSTQLAARLEPEDWRHVVRRYQEAAGQVIEALDGHVAQYLGDGLLVYFGYPRAHEDDAFRAVSAGLGILAALPGVSAELGQRLPTVGEHPLEVRIGIHTGPVVVGEMGGGAAREQLALGDSVNVAARLQAVAEPGWVVTSEATRSIVQGLFFLEELGEKSLKGLAEPVSVVRVVQASGFQTRFELATEAGLTPLVGREQEFALLLDRWKPVAEGHGQAVMVSGEAGMGKSRLVQQVHEQLAGERLTWLECRCSPYHENSALHPLLGFLEAGLMFDHDDSPEEKIRRLEGALQAVGFALPETVPLFATLLSVPLPERYAPSPLSAETQRKNTMETLVAWLLAVSIEQPVAMVMEDLHWSDPSTLELLGTLIEQLPSARVLLLLTFRPDFEPPWTTRSRPLHLTLYPLTRKQTETMIERVAGGKALPAIVLEQLITKTDGVPLYVEELTKAVIESDVVHESDGRYERTDPLPDLAVPATLQDSLMARLDRLGTGKEVAQLASVLGREFPHELLVAVASMDSATLESGLQELADAELLHRRGVPPRAVYTFKHALIRDTAYQSLLKGARRRSHGRVARALEEDFPEQTAAQPEVVARHYEEAGQTGRAIDLYQRAGDRAAERSANAEAISHLRKGLEILTRLPDGTERSGRELALRVALGAPLVAAMGYSNPEVEETYGRARELSQTIGEAPQLARALYGLVTYYTARAELGPAVEVAQQLLALGERSREPHVLIMGHLGMGVSLYWRGEPARCLEHFEQSMALYDPAQHQELAFVYGQDPDLFSRSLASWALWLIGRSDEAVRRAVENVELARRSAHVFSVAFALAYGAVVYQMRPEKAQAAAWAAEAVALAQEHGFPLPLGVGKVIHGWAVAESGSGAAAVEEVQQGLSALVGAETQVGGPYVLCLLADTQARIGRLDDALATVRGALAVSAQTNQRFWDSDLYRLTGDLLLEKGDGAAGEAEQSFARALEVARKQGAKTFELRAAVRLARFRMSRGEEAEARALVQPIYEGFTEGFDTQDLKDAEALLDELA